MTHTINLTPEYIKRVNQSIIETENLLNKELAISKDLQYADRIKFYTGHINKLKQFIKEGKITNQIPE